MQPSPSILAVRNGTCNGCESESLIRARLSADIESFFPNDASAAEITSAAEVMVFRGSAVVFVALR